MDISLHKNFITENTQTIFNNLLALINWQNELTITGTTDKKKIHRKMSYVTDKPQIYQYANLELQGETWNADLQAINDMLFQKMNKKFNSVLLNLYEDGKDEIRWHSDKEEQLGDNPVIACVNLGAARNFWFLEKSTGVKTAYRVEDGDLLIMHENCQKNYMHAILKEKDITQPRISLTYRWVS